MKKYFSIILFTAAVSFTGCLKDDKANLTPNNSPAVIEWSTAVTADAPISPSGSTYTLYLRSLEIKSSIDITFEVNYTGGEAAPQDITVNYGLDNDALIQYNTERDVRDHQTVHLEPLPTAWYTINGTSVVIKKGERKAVITGKVNTTNITDFDKKYVLPLKITSVSSGTISGNYGTILMQIGAKNPYDGIFNYKSSATQSLHPSANDNDAKLKTVDLTHVSTNLVNTYSNITVYAVDPATNKITVTDSGGIGAATTDPSSHWDPATKVFYVKWKTSNRQFEETYTYLKPR